MEKPAPRLIMLSSNEGQKLLSESTCYNSYIHRIFAKQIGISNCGIQSTALLLNSEVLAKRDRENDHSLENNDIPYTESNMFSFEATTKVATEDYIYKRGLTLEETLNIFINHGKDAEAFHSANSSVDEFRTLAFKALKNTKNGSGVVVNYHMAELGQGQLGGHHSPLGAYHKDSDRFLIFDTWYDTEECWATTEDLFRSMTGIDKFSGKTRGFLVVHGHF